MNSQGNEWNLLNLKKKHGQALKIQWFLLNEICKDTHSRDCCGKDSSKKFYLNVDGDKSTELGMSFCSSKKRIILIGICGWHQNCWKEAEFGFHVEEIDEKRGSWWTHIIYWSRIFGTYSTWMQTEWNYDWGIYKNVWITCSRWSNWKITGVGEASRKNSSVVLWHGRTCSIVRWEVFGFAKKKEAAIVQSINPLIGWSQLQEGGVGNSLRIIRCMFSDSLEMLDGARAATKWTQTCDRRLARLISYIHDTNDYRQYYHVGNAAQHCRLGLFPDSDFAGDFEDSKSTSEGVLCSEHLSPSVGCARNKTSVSSVLQNLRSFRWMLDCEWMDYLLSTSGTW